MNLPSTFSAGTTSAIRNIDGNGRIVGTRRTTVDIDVLANDTDDNGDTLTITDVDAGAVEGIAITSLASGNGTWQFSTNGGGLWTSFGDRYALLSVLRFVASAGLLLLFEWDNPGTLGNETTAATIGNVIVLAGGATAQANNANLVFPIPEPSTSLLMALGLVRLAVTGRPTRLSAYAR